VPEFTARDGTISQRRINQRTSVAVYDGRASLMVAFSARCQSIEIAVERAVAPAAATGPSLIPNANLGCDEYPSVSVRLQEGGSVTLNVHVLKDGSVSGAIITAADRSMRLNEAALRIALMRLRFTPATVNGEAIDADVSVRTEFAVIHPIHGNL